MPKIIFVNDKYETYDDLWNSKPDIDGYEWVRYEKDYDVDDSTWATSNLTEAAQWVATGWYHLTEGTEAEEPYDWNDLKPKIEYIINRT